MLKQLNQYKEFRNLVTLCAVILSGFMQATIIQVFMRPLNLLSSGFTGVAILVEKITSTYFGFTFSTSLGMLVLNIPIALFCCKSISKRFTFFSLLQVIIASFFLKVIHFEALFDDRLLNIIFGGLLYGMQAGIALQANASTGGTDLITYIAKAYKPYVKTSNIIVIVDVIIIGLNVLFFKKVEIGLYSAISIYLMGKMIDIVFEGVNFTKMVYIISQEYTEIAKEIDKQLQRGSTGIYAKGMYTNTDKLMLLCVGSRNEVAKMKQIATQIDPKAFIIISNAREIWGKGFKGV